MVPDQCSHAALCHGPHPWDLMLCGRHLDVLNNIISNLCSVGDVQWDSGASAHAWFHLPPSTPAYLPEMMGPQMPAPHLLVTLALLGLPHTTLALGCYHLLPLGTDFGKVRVGEPHGALGVGQGGSTLGRTLGRALSSTEDAGTECVPAWRS